MIEPGSSSLSRRSSPVSAIPGAHQRLLQSSLGGFFQCFWFPVDFRSGRFQDIRGLFHCFCVILVTFAVFMIERLSARTTASCALLPENGTHSGDQPDPASLERLAREAASRELGRQIQERDREIEKAKQMKVPHEGSLQELMAKLLKFRAASAIVPEKLYATTIGDCFHRANNCPPLHAARPCKTLVTCKPCF